MRLRPGLPAVQGLASNQCVGGAWCPDRLCCALQVENEYGYCGSDKAYLRHLLATARQQLGGDVILFTTDPPDLAHLGSLPGGQVFTCAPPALQGSQRCEDIMARRKCLCDPFAPQHSNAAFSRTAVLIACSQGLSNA